jgi:hypothetical protein
LQQCHLLCHGMRLSLASHPECGRLADAARRYRAETADTQGQGNPLSALDQSAA